MQLEEYFDLGNLFFEDVNFDQISDVDGSHLDSSDLVEITDGSCPYTMHDPIQSSKGNFIFLESFGTHQGLEALQLLLMVMSSSCDSSKIPEISQIWIFSQNSFLYMVSLGCEFLLERCSLF